MKKYRIVTDSYGGYDVQKRVLFIFWENQTFMGFDTVKQAEEWINSEQKREKKEKQMRKQAGNIIKYL